MAPPFMVSEVDQQEKIPRSTTSEHQRPDQFCDHKKNGSDPRLEIGALNCTPDKIRTCNRLIRSQKK